MSSFKELASKIAEKQQQDKIKAQQLEKEKGKEMAKIKTFINDVNEALQTVQRKEQLCIVESSDSPMFKFPLDSDTTEFNEFFASINGDLEEKKAICTYLKISIQLAKVNYAKAARGIDGKNVTAMDETPESPETLPKREKKEYSFQVKPLAGFKDGGKKVVQVSAKCWFPTHKSAMGSMFRGFCEKVGTKIPLSKGKEITLPAPIEWWYGAQFYINDDDEKYYAFFFFETEEEANLWKMLTKKGMDEFRPCMTQKFSDGGEKHHVLFICREQTN
jgi:hypothetical protein